MPRCGTVLGRRRQRPAARRRRQREHDEPADGEPAADHRGGQEPGTGRRAVDHRTRTAGAPSALPTVDMVPLQPMTSPRRCSGTSRTSVALIDDSAGAHGSPATTTATASHTWPLRERRGDGGERQQGDEHAAATALRWLAPWTSPPIDRAARPQRDHPADVGRSGRRR